MVLISDPVGSNPRFNHSMLRKERAKFDGPFSRCDRQSRIQHGRAKLTAFANVKFNSLWIFLRLFISHVIARTNGLLHPSQRFFGDSTTRLTPLS